MNDYKLPISAVISIQQESLVRKSLESLVNEQNFAKLDLPKASIHHSPSNTNLFN